MLKASDLPADLQKKLAGQMRFPRRTKYNVAAKHDRTCDGITFDSKAEMVWYQQLKLGVAGGHVRYFLRQVPFHLPGGVVYRADFMVVYSGGNVEFHDVKGMRTKEYIMKKKQVEDLYPVVIREIEVK